MLLPWVFKTSALCLLILTILGLVEVIFDTSEINFNTLIGLFEHTLKI